MSNWLIFGGILITVVIVLDTVLAFGNYFRSTNNKRKIEELNDNIHQKKQ